MEQLIINGIDYTDKLQAGYVLNETLTEELDSMTIIINDVPKTLFEPFQNVVITTTTNETFYFYISTSMEEIYDQEQETYTYTLPLISQTKILERVYLPNMKIRKQIEGTTKTISNVVFKIMRYVNNQFPFINRIPAPEFLNATDGVECPEIEWNHPNAKQAINDLLMTIPGNPCIVRLRNNRVSLVSLSQKKKNVEQYEGIKIMPSSDYEQMGDFANNIIMDAREIIPKESNTVYTTTLRGPKDTAVVSTNNIDLYIPEARIESIEKLIIKGIQIRYTRNNLMSPQTQPEYRSEILDLDISKYVKEESEYMAIPDRQSQAPGKITKDQCLYFKRGTNVIKGFNRTTSYVVFDKVAIETIIQKAWEKTHEFDYRYYEAFDKIFTDEISMVFEITYKNVGDVRIKAVKENQEDKDVSIYQSQNQSAIDFKAMMKTQRESVNRLGNEIKTSTMMCECDKNKIPQLGDYYRDDYILSQREVAFYNDFVLVNATFSKDYVQKNIYYGIKSRKQFTQLAQRDEAVVREEFQRKLVVFSFNQPPIGAQEIDQYFADYFNGTKGNNVKAFIFKTDKMENYASIIPFTYTADKSVTLTAKCDDNYSIGMKLVSGSQLGEQRYVRYADESTGEFTNYWVQLHNQLITNYNTPEVLKQMPDINVGAGSILNDYVGGFNKDNGETLQMTYQFDFTSDNENIIIGDGIGEENSLAINADLSKTKVYAMSGKVSKRYPVLANVIASETPQTFGGTNSIQFQNPFLYNNDSIKSYALANEDGEIIIAVNRDDSDGTLRKTLYIQVKGERE